MAPGESRGGLNSRDLDRDGSWCERDCLDDLPLYAFVLDPCRGGFAVRADGHERRQIVCAGGMGDRLWRAEAESCRPKCKVSRVGLRRPAWRSPCERRLTGRVARQARL
jgi:hypothetical protein